MRKALKFLLLAVMLLVMVGMTMMVASAEGEAADPFEVFSGETSHGTFATFADAMAAVKTNGADTIKVLADVTLSETMLIDTPVTINGQGHTITFPVDFYGDSSNWKHAVELATTGEATLTNIVIDVLGGSHMDGDKTVWDYVTAIGINSTGTLKIYNAEVKGGYHLLRTAQAGKLVVDGADSKLGLSHRSGFWRVEAPGTFEIKAGLVDATNTGSDAFSFTAGGKGANFVMSGGTYKTGGDALYSGQPYNITVTGGTIWAKGNGVNPGGNGSKVSLSNCTITVGGETGAANCAITNCRGGADTEFVLDNVTMSGGYMIVQGGAKMTIKGEQTAITLVGQFTLGGSSTLTILGGSMTAPLGNYMIDLNSSGSLLDIRGGNFYAPENPNFSMIRLNDTGSTIKISGGNFTMDASAFTGTALNIVDKNNGNLEISGSPVFTVKGNAECLNVSQSTASSYTVINGGTFRGTPSGYLVEVGSSNGNANAFVINDCLMITDGGAGSVMSISMSSKAVATINGGDFVSKNWAYNVRFYGSNTGFVNVNDGYFSYIEREYVYNADGTMKTVANLKNSNGYTASNGMIFMNSGSTVTIKGGVFIGGDSSKNFRLNRADNLIFDGDAELYGYRNIDYTMSSGKVCITIYDVKLGNVPGQTNRLDFVCYGDPFGDLPSGETRETWTEKAIKNSFIKIYGGDFANYKGGGAIAQLLINQPITVVIGGEYVKDSVTYQSNVHFAGSAGAPLIEMTAADANLTLNSGLFSSKAAHVNITAGNVTFNEGVFFTYLDNITGPDQIDPKAAAIPKRTDGATACNSSVIKTTGTVVFNGGVYQSGDSFSSFDFYTKVTINGGTFMGYRAIRLYAGADVTVEGGNFYGANGYVNGHVINLAGAGAKLTFNGGTVSMEYNATNALQSGGLFNVQADATLIINDGTFIADNYPSSSGLALINVTSAAGADVTVNGGAFEAIGTNFSLFKAPVIAILNEKEEIIGYETSITLAGGEFTVQGGANIATDLYGIVFESADFIIGQGSGIPTEEIAGYDSHFANATWLVKSWDRFEVSSAITFASLADCYAACTAYVENYIVNVIGYMDIIPGDNCTIEITEWVPFTVVDGGDLTINFADKLTVYDTLVTVEGGKVTVLGGEYVGADFGNTLNGLFHVLGGELILKDGSYTMTDGGSIVYFVSNANADVTIEDGTYLLDNAGAHYHQGSVVRVGAWEDPVYGTLTIKGGDFTATRAVTIYAQDLDGEDNAVDGFTANVLGGTFTGNALENVNADNKYLFQIARDGKHTINVSNATITGSAYGTLFIANASGMHATFNLDKVDVSGGLTWIYSNMPNVVFNVTNSTFTDITGEMSGWRGSLIGVEHASGAFEMNFENVTFNATSDVALFAPWSTGGTTTLENVTATVAKFLYPNSKGTFNVDGLLLVITGEADTVFHVANPSITEAIVVANATYVISGVEFGATKVMKGGVAYGAYIKVSATDANYTTTQEAGAAIDVTSEFIATNPEKGGIRFLSTISEEVAEMLLSDYAGATFSFGTLIAPADYVVAAGAFTMEALDKLQVSGVKYVDIPAVDTFADANGDGIPESFSGALIKLKSYTRAYAGISYIKITSFGETTYLYGEFDSVTNARSAKQVADAMIADGNSAYHTEYSAEQKAVVDAYAGKVSE